MRKVLHILPRTPIGGVGSFLINVEKNLTGNYKFDYLIIEDVDNSKFISSVEELGSKVFLLNEKLSFSNIISIKRKINELLKNTDYKAVHLHSANIALLVFPICKKNNIPIRILHSHSTKYSDNLIKSIRNYLLELPIFKYTTHLIACSEVSGKFLFKNREYTVVYNGIDTNKFFYKNERKNSDKVIIGHVGNFVPVKNHDFLIKVFKKLTDRDNKYELWLFGDGSIKKNIENKVKKYKLEDKVFFYGRINNIQDYYNKIDLFLLPSLYEGFPVAAMEAQAHGLPVIASARVTKEIDFYGDDVFLNINNADILSWVETIQKINLNNKKDKSNKFNSSKFNIIKTALELEKFYDFCFKNVD